MVNNESELIKCIDGDYKKLDGVLECLLKKVMRSGTTLDDVLRSGKDHDLYECIECDDPYNSLGQCHNYRSLFYYHMKKVKER